MKHKEMTSFFMKRIINMNGSAKSNKIYKSSYKDNSNYKQFKDNIQELADAIKVSAKKLKKKQEQENKKENDKELQEQEKTDKDDLKK